MVNIIQTGPAGGQQQQSNILPILLQFALQQRAAETAEERRVTGEKRRAKLSEQTAIRGEERRAKTKFQRENIQRFVTAAMADIVGGDITEEEALVRAETEGIFEGLPPMSPEDKARMFDVSRLSQEQTVGFINAGIALESKTELKAVQKAKIELADFTAKAGIKTREFFKLNPKASLVDLLKHFVEIRDIKGFERVQKLLTNRQIAQAKSDEVTTSRIATLSKSIEDSTRRFAEERFRTTAITTDPAQGMLQSLAKSITMRHNALNELLTKQGLPALPNPIAGFLDPATGELLPRGAPGQIIQAPKPQVETPAQAPTPSPTPVSPTIPSVVQPRSENIVPADAQQFYAVFKASPSSLTMLIARSGQEPQVVIQAIRAAAQQAGDIVTVAKMDAKLRAFGAQ